ncbi:MAG: hypothetical protein COC01_07185 [Bacteroidetes bacterium]|nr:DUF4293 domain-containing protein [Bacteroidia bacterium]PCH66827.1 MAG: hypothetical protein COC01_07185 [Bacteroidota bacterium]
MIQRIQSVYLFLSGIACLLLLYFPFYKISVLTDTTNMFDIQINLWGINMIGAESNVAVVVVLTIIISILTIVTGMLSLFTIANYSRRELQMKLCKINFLLITGLLACMVWYLDDATKILCMEQCEKDVALGMFLPALAIIFTFLANKGIKKDHDMIKAADRIR